MIFSRPFEMVTFGGVIAFIWTVGVSVLLFLSVARMIGSQVQAPVSGTAPGNAFYELYLSDTKYLLKQKDSVLFPAEMAGNREGPFLQGTLFLLS